MEQSPETEITPPKYKIYLHPKCQSDLGRLHPEMVDVLLDTIKKRLGSRPEFVGNPLKGTANRLWKFRFTKIRTVYTIISETFEVWILAIQQRNIVYRPEHLESLLRIAIALHQSRVK